MCSFQIDYSQSVTDPGDLARFLHDSDPEMAMWKLKRLAMLLNGRYGRNGDPVEQMRRVRRILADY